MKTRRWIAAALAALVTAAGATPAWAAFEDIEISPRARAFGGSSAASLADEYAAFHNPASLAWTKGLGAAASTVRPFGFDFATQNAVAVAVALPHRLGGVSLGVRRFGVEWLGESLTGETTVALAHGFHLRRDRQSELAIGWALDVYALDFGRSVTGLDPGNANAVGVSVGATAVVRDRTRVGFQATNLNNPVIGEQDREELRRCVTVGVSYAPYPGVETVLDIAQEMGREVQYRGGAEFAVAEMLLLRAGLQTGPYVFSAGLGLHHRGLGFDYGFSMDNLLGETHQFGIRYQFSRTP